jgi:MFS family permease
MTKQRLGGRFWRLWSASAASSLGDGMLAVALPLLATSLTTDARLVAAVAVAETLPWLLFAVVAGALADRNAYRKVLIFADVVRMVLVGALGMLALTDQLSIVSLIVGAFGLGTMKPLFDAAAHRAIPSVVDDALLEKANGYLEATLSGADEIIGRAVGGVLYAVARSLPILADAVSFAASAVVLRTLPSDEPVVESDAPRPTLRADMAEGLRWFRGNKLIRLITGVTAAMAIAQSMVLAVLVLIAKQRYGVSSRWFGVFVGATSIGGIIGSLVASRLMGAYGRFRVIIVAIAIVATMYLVSWATTNAFDAATAMSIQIGAISTANVAIFTIRQRVVPRAIIGRVSTVIRTFVWGAIPIGSAIGGALAHRYGVRSPLLVAAVLAFVVALAAGPPLRRSLREAQAAAVQ